MLDTDFVNTLTDPVAKLYEKAETDLLAEIVKNLKTKNLDNIDYQTERLIAMGGMKKKIKKILSETARLSNIQIDKVFSKVVREALLRYGVNEKITPSVVASIKAITQKAKNQLNLVNTIMNSGTIDLATNTFKQLNNEAQGILSKGLVKGATFQKSVEDTIKDTIRDLNQKGITAFIDNAGRSWSPEAYVRMDIRTMMNSTAREVVEAQGRDLGLDIILVSSHSGARPKCAPYQGKCYSLSGKSGTIKDINGKTYHYEPIEITSKGQPDGLFGINCHHTFRYVQSGAFQPTKDEKKLNAKTEKENEEQYKLTQQQRAMERKIRAYRREGYLDNLNKKGLGAEANGKANTLYSQYISFCNRYNLRPNRENTEIVV